MLLSGSGHNGCFIFLCAQNLGTFFEASRILQVFMLTCGVRWGIVSGKWLTMVCYHANKGAILDKTVLKSARACFNKQRKPTTIPSYCDSHRAAWSPPKQRCIYGSLTRDHWIMQMIGLSYLQFYYAGKFDKQDRLVETKPCEWCIGTTIHSRKREEVASFLFSSSVVGSPSIEDETTLLDALAFAWGYAKPSIRRAYQKLLENFLKLIFDDDDNDSNDDDNDDLNNWKWQQQSPGEASRNGGLSASFLSPSAQVPKAKRLDLQPTPANVVVKTTTKNSSTTWHIHVTSSEPNGGSACVISLGSILDSPALPENNSRTWLDFGAALYGANEATNDKAPPITCEATTQTNFQSRLQADLNDGSISKDCEQDIRRALFLLFHQHQNNILGAETLPSEGDTTQGCASRLKWHSDPATIREWIAAQDLACVWKILIKLEVTSKDASSAAKWFWLICWFPISNAWNQMRLPWSFNNWQNDTRWPSILNMHVSVICHSVLLWCCTFLPLPEVSNGFNN